MLLVLHIVIALSSIAFSGLAFLAPTVRKLHISYALIATTLATGSWLVVTTHTAMLAACTTGLLYLAVVLSETFLVRLRLAKSLNR